MATGPAFLTAKEVAALLGLEPYTFKAMVAKGDLPQPHTITGKRLKMWALSDIDGMVWLIQQRNRMRKSTPDEIDEAEDD